MPRTLDETAIRDGQLGKGVWEWHWGRINIAFRKVFRVGKRNKLEVWGMRPGAASSNIAFL
jgi:hypothetical protein